MVVLENGLLLDGVLYAVLDLIRRLFRFEVHQTSGVLSVFEDMNDGVGRPFALIDLRQLQEAHPQLYGALYPHRSVDRRCPLQSPIPQRQGAFGRYP